MLLVLAIPVGSLVGMSLYLHRAISADAAQKVETTLEMAINMEETLLKEDLVDMQQAAAAVGADPGVAAGLSNRQARVDLKRFQHAFPRADMILLVDRQGVVRARVTSEFAGDQVSLDGLVENAMAADQPLAYPAVFSPAELDREGPSVHELVDMPILKTAGSTDPRVGGRVDSALALTGIAPIAGPDGAVIGAVICADVLNRDFRVVDEVAQWAPASMPMNATIAMGAVRVSTNVMLTDAEQNQYDKRALGTLYPDAVMQSLAATGQHQGRAFVLNEWHWTDYRALRDYKGQMIAAAYVGTPEAAFLVVAQDLAKYLWVASLAGGTALLIAGLVALWLSRRGIVLPVRRIVQLLETGDQDVVLTHPDNDEIGDLVHAVQRRFDRWRGALASMQAISAELDEAVGGLVVSADAADIQAVVTGAPGAAAGLRAGAAEAVENLRRLAGAITAVGDGARHEERSVLYMGRVAAEIATGLDESRQSLETAVTDAGRLTAAARGALKQAGEFAAGLALLRQDLESADRSQALDLLRDPSDMLTGLAALAERVAEEVRKLVLTIQENQARLVFIREEMARVGGVVQKTAAATQEAAGTADAAIGWMEGMAGNAVAVADAILAAQSGLEGMASAGQELQAMGARVQEQSRRFRQVVADLQNPAR